jgi:ATP-dependent Lhr-like helicase
MIRIIYPHIEVQSELVVPSEYALRSWHTEEAIIELIRGRLQSSGPVTAWSLSQLLMIDVNHIDAALIALEAQGFALRGQFTPDATQLEWCERRLLARIHRYTIQTLRAEIEPVSTADFMRFLLQWQGVIREPRPQGVEALSGTIEQLEGIAVSAAAWESDVLPARLHEYDPNWLDSVCLSGRATWMRMNAPKAATAGPVRATPIVLLTRKNARQWQCWVNDGMGDLDIMHLSHPAQRMFEYLQTHGASFFADISQGTHLLQSQAEDGLSELVAAGVVSADSFSGLRALVLPMDRKRKMATRGMRIAQFGLEDAGRWTLVKHASSDEQSSLAALVFILLKRYGVVFRKLLIHESDQLPAWHELLRVFRQLEAQGLIRGGRFIAGVTGEQYALPEAVAALRAVRKQTHDGKLISLSAADPLNLSGVLIPGPRIPALTGNRLLLRDGELIASCVGGQTTLHAQFEPADEWAARNALLHKRVMVPMHSTSFSQ